MIDFTAPPSPLPPPQTNRQVDRAKFMEALRALAAVHQMGIVAACTRKEYAPGEPDSARTIDTHHSLTILAANLEDVANFCVTLLRECPPLVEALAREIDALRARRPTTSEHGTA